MTETERINRAKRAALAIARAPCATLDTVLRDGPEEDLLALERIIERLHVVREIDWQGGGLMR